MQRSLATALLMLATTYAMAAPSRPWLPPETDDTPTTLHTTPTPTIQIGAITITLEQDRLSTLHRHHIVGRVDRSGDAADALAWACTTAITPSENLSICLSSGEIEGTDTIGAVTIEPRSRPTPHATPRPVTIAGKIPFGTKLNTLIQTLGPPSRTTTSTPGTTEATWAYSQPATTRPHDPFTTSGRLIARYDHDRMTRLYLSRTTAN